MCREKKKKNNVVRCTGATSFNSSLLRNSTQVTIALLNGIQTAWENSSSFLVKGSGKPPFFPLLVIPTGGSPFSFLGLSSNIYNPSSEEPTPLWRARRGGPAVLLQPSMRSAGTLSPEPAPAAPGRVGQRAPAASGAEAQQQAPGSKGPPEARLSPLPSPANKAAGRGARISRSPSAPRPGRGP